MEIQKINGAISADISTKKEPVTSPKPTETAPKLQLAHKSVSDDWKMLASSQQALQQMDDMDQTKMLEIRQSLRGGTFTLDIDAIAEAMLSQHGKSDDQ
ncbi:flagellar biosynthesis anti-sigma factor FlgM [Shewanella sp. VB17]|uniref:flagellar biosynthesis anti-sigma factor FlgM n=1 Tax=Shewanella sp. VB17 TaxID=2739432 RepID=UPI0015644DA1|nr:flagellar biosynthesis anti-sigma factor FlgM [Shewanella sp. VB17]NRD72002.1 flagellar biosynthesis anti-sigma factor FlgM [Shewanella sp. VB17]